MISAFLKSKKWDYHDTAFQSTSSTHKFLQLWKNVTSHKIHGEGNINETTLYIYQFIPLFDIE